MQSDMFGEYGAIFLQAVAAFAVAAGALATSMILGKVGRRNADKDRAYECGMEAVGTASPRFSVKFYLIAMLFILFDIEIVFLYPWAVVFKEMAAETLVPLWAMLVFQMILGIGFVYEFRKGALNW